jgi:ADP-ribose pyrophosphatase
MELTSIQKRDGGRYLTRYDLTYRMADGRSKVYEMVSRAPDRVADVSPGLLPDGVVLLVWNADRTRVLLNREFRPAVGRTVYNFPAGLLAPGESTAQAAARELREETGLCITRVLGEYGSSYGAVGISDENAALCVCQADDSLPFCGHPGPAEEIEPLWAGKGLAAELLRGGSVTARVQLFFAQWTGAL